MCTELSPWERVVQFHGHVCPGIAAGYRVAMRLLEELGRQYPPGDDCIIEAGRHFCGLDALQLLLGTTFGKGNLVVRETGRYAFRLVLLRQGRQIELEVTPHLTELEAGWRQLFEEKQVGVAAGRQAELIAAMVQLAQQVMDLEEKDFFVR